MDLTIAQDIECGLEAFWSKIFFDAAYNKALYLEALRFPAWKTIEQTDKGGTIVRRVEVTPPSEMPAAIEKFVGGGVSYIETGTFDKTSKIYRYEIVPSKMADRLELGGLIRGEPISDKRIRRIGELKIKAKIFGLGGMIEGFLAKSMKDSYEVAARFTNDWIRKQGL